LIAAPAFSSSQHAHVLQSADAPQAILGHESRRISQMAKAMIGAEWPRLTGGS